MLAKPLFAWLALRWEKRLRKLRSQKHWVEARVAAELCRSSLTTWRFAQAPLRLFNEEDFPHFKRLIRTLRIARELDSQAATTAGEDDAYDLYVEQRIGGAEKNVGQIGYFAGKHSTAVREHARWQFRFNVATWTVIALGLIFGIAETCYAFSSVGTVHGAPDEGVLSWLLHGVGPFVACVLIVAPFYASYALAVLSIRDCRRRSERFQTMKEFLERQKERIEKIKSPASRIAVLENTERMLLEELHEWYSIMRVVTV